MNTQPVRFFTFNKIIMLATPLVLTLSAIPFLMKPNLEFYPDNPDLELTSYVDTINSGNEGGTVIHAFDTTGPLIDLQYTIGPRNIYPYAGFQWIVKRGNPWVDLCGYDHCTFTIDSSTTEEVLILILQFFTEHFSTIDDRMTWRYQSYELPLSKGQTTYSIPLKEFQTPLWWYNQYKKTEKEFSLVDLSKLGMLSIEDGSDAVGKARRIVLKSLRFEKKQGYYIAQMLLITLLLYYILFFSVQWMLHRVKKYKKPVVIPYQKLSIENSACNGEQKIFEYLGNNFSNPDISLSFVNDELKIAGNKISLIIKEKYNLSFRQYLNTIRITEAKRLLQETKLQISQVGYKVGYSNLTHFCRTFKEVEGVSPNAFRSECSESVPDPEETPDAITVR